MIEPAETFEHAGLTVEIVPDDEGGISDPQDHDNAGTIYSWADGFDGDEAIHEPDLQVDEEDDWNKPSRWRTIDLAEFMSINHGAALTLGLRFEDYGSSGARIHLNNDDPNAAIVFTQKELDADWSGSVDDATKYAKARINELDNWLQGNVYGIVIREPSNDGITYCAEGKGVRAEVLASVWGFIGDIFGDRGEREYIWTEAKAMAEGCAEEIAAEKAKAYEWACRDVVTV